MELPRPALRDESAGFRCGRHHELDLCDPAKPQRTGAVEARIAAGWAPPPLAGSRGPMTESAQGSGAMSPNEESLVGRGSDLSDDEPYEIAVRIRDFWRWWDGFSEELDTAIREYRSEKLFPELEGVVIACGTQVPRHVCQVLRRRPAGHHQ